MHNNLISAFASFVEKSPTKIQGRKRKISNTNNQVNAKRDTSFYVPEKRPTIHDTRQSSRVTLNCDKSEKSSSPPFLGFDNNNKTINARPNIRNIDKVPLRRSSKELQEESDLAFAKQLQEELNRNSRYFTRNSIIQKNVLKKRQITLDGFMNSPKPAVT